MSSGDRDERDPLQSLIAEILDTENRGEAVDRDSLLAEHCEHADSLRAFFASHDQMKSAADVDPSTLPTRSSCPATKDPTIAPAASPVDDPTLPPTEPAGDDPTLPPTEGTSKPVEPTVGDKVRYFGDYELLEEIARGGMGVVYKARQMNLNRTVALKMILSGQFAGEEDVQRFYTEAEAAASLDHPGIVPIYEIGEHAGQHYFSMGYIEGDSLAHKVVDGPLPPREAAELVKKICDAMAYAHERGVIHRDLKPANILIDATGQPKVTDFGLAKKTETDSNLTGTGQIIGTPAYMPPEQASGRTDEVGPLADVYSLGAILYCLLTGRPPFQAASPMDTLLQVLDREPIPPRQINPDVHADLGTICLTCLNKQCDKRYQTALEISAELQRFLNGEPIHARPVSQVERAWRWCRRKPVIAGLGAVTTILMLVLSLGGPLIAIQQSALRSEADNQTRKAIESESAERLAKEKLERTLARSNYFLATARWDANRTAQAKEFLEEIPKHHRNFEWYLSKSLFLGSDLTCNGHTSTVSRVAYSPNGKQIASVSYDKTIKLWDAQTGDEIRTLKGHSGSVYGVSISPDGKRIASGSHDKSIKVWDAATGKEIRTLEGHTDRVLNVSFSPDGSMIASASSDKTVRLWDAQTGKELEILVGHAGQVNCVKFSPDSTHVASGSTDGTTRFWNINSGKEARTLKGQSLVTSVSFSPDSTQFASASSHSVRVWDAKTFNEVRTLKHTDLVTSVSFSPDGMRIASASYDSTIKLWDAKTGEVIHTLKGHASLANSLSFSPDGSRIASGSSDNTVKVWDAKTGGRTRTISSASTVLDVSYSPKGSRIATASSDKTVKLWDEKTGDKLRTLEGHTGVVRSVAFSPNGRLIASGSHDKSIKIWDTQSGREINTLDGHTGAVNSVAFSPDGMQIVSGSQDETIKVWNVQTSRELKTLESNAGHVDCVLFSPDGTRIASGSYELLRGKVLRGSIKLWDASTYEEVRTLRQKGDVNCLSYRQDGAQIASGSGDKSIRLWNVDTGEELRTLQGHSKRVKCVSFSPDGTRIASGGEDNTIKLWDAQTGQELSAIRGHIGHVNAVVFSPSRKQIASGGDDGTIRLWEGQSDSDGEKLYKEFKSRLDPIWHYQNARTAKKSGNLFAARFHDEWALKADLPLARKRSTFSMHYRDAKDLREAGHLEEARRMYRQALDALGPLVEENPLKRFKIGDTPGISKVSLYFTLSSIERELGNHSDEQSVWKELTAMLEANPSPASAGYWSYLGQCYYHLDRFQEARDALEKVVAMRQETEPSVNDGPRWWYLTMILAQVGETELATNYYEKLVSQLGENANESPVHFQVESAKLLGLSVETDQSNP